MLIGIAVGNMVVLDKLLIMLKKQALIIGVPLLQAQQVMPYPLHKL